MASLEERKKKYNKFVRTIFTYLLVILISFTLTFTFSKYVAGLAYVPSISMCDTLQVGDKLLVAKSEYKFKEIQRGDIILFYSDQVDDEHNILVKRVIGLSGDTVTINKGVVSVNGKKLDESYAKKDDYSGEFKVPKDSLFVLGDNREHSFDSRYWENHYVKKSKVIGKVLYRIYPNPREFE